METPFYADGDAPDRNHQESFGTQNGFVREYIGPAFLRSIHVLN